MRALAEQMSAMTASVDLQAIGAAEMQQRSAAGAAAFGIGPEVARIEDLTVDGGAGSLSARLYRPGRDMCGLIVYLHGGGWVLGSLESHDAMLRRLALAAHCAIISVDYRLAPQYPFPAALEDSYAALNGIARRADNILGQTVPLIVAGDSTGGNLATCTAMLVRDRGGPPLAAQLLLYPNTDGDFTRASYEAHAEGCSLTTETMKWFWDQYIPDPDKRTNPLASPLRSPDLRGLPPAMIEIAAFDPLFDENTIYAERLEAAGVPTKVRIWDGLCHGFAQMAMILPPAGAAVDRIGHDLRAWLASQDADPA